MSHISSFRSRRPRIQPPLFGELVEFLVTRDALVDLPDGSWETRVVRPPGKGWRIIDFSTDRRTHWMRRRPVPWPVRPSPGGWRRR